MFKSTFLGKRSRELEISQFDENQKSFKFDKSLGNSKKEDKFWIY